MTLQAKTLEERKRKAFKKHKEQSYLADAVFHFCCIINTVSK